MGGATLGCVSAGGSCYLSPPTMDATDVRRQLKTLLIEELNLQGKSPDDIDDAAPLFGEGLGLDSLDALQLAMVVEERFGVKVPEGDAARPIFASVDALVAHIVATRGA
jgi:acyl carrier protein